MATAGSPTIMVTCWTPAVGCPEEGMRMASPSRYAAGTVLRVLAEACEETLRRGCHRVGYCSTCGTRSTIQVPAEHRATLSSVGAMHFATGQLVAAQLWARQASWAASASLSNAWSQGGHS